MVAKFVVAVLQKMCNLVHHRFIPKNAKILRRTPDDIRVGWGAGGAGFSVIRSFLRFLGMPTRRFALSDRRLVIVFLQLKLKTLHFLPQVPVSLGQAIHVVLPAKPVVLGLVPLAPA